MEGGLDRDEVEACGVSGHVRVHRESGPMNSASYAGG